MIKISIQCVKIKDAQPADFRNSKKWKLRICVLVTVAVTNLKYVCWFWRC